MIHFRLFLILVLFPFFAIAQKGIEVKINEVERNLLPKTQIKGTLPQTFDLEERMRFHKVPGLSIAVLNDGKVEWEKGYGYMSSDSLEKVSTKTLFQAASISKPIAALAALVMVEEGKLDLDKDVNSYLSSWKVPESKYTQEEKVTLRRLLTHTAGLTVHGFRGYALGEKMPNTLQVLEGSPPANSAKIQPDTFPGALWRYSGGGYTVMQQVLTEISGQAFPELMNQKVLLRLGMKNSTYSQPLPFALRKQASLGNRSEGKKVVGDWHTYPEMAAAGLWTTPTDLLKYAMEIQKILAGNYKGIISREMAEKMIQKDKNNWGLGPAISGEGEQLAFQHGGSNEGFKCTFFAYAHKGQGVAIMTNGDNGSRLADEILRSVSKVYGWDVFKTEEKLILNLGPEALAEYAGRYRIQAGLYADITVEGNVLSVQPSWQTEKISLYAEKTDQFFALDVPGNFSFLRDNQGNISGLRNQNTELKKEEE